MTEPRQASGETGSDTGRANQAAWFCDWLREGANKASEMLCPPGKAAKHFREARLEVLRGIREVIDYRIDQLSKDKTAKGSRIVVE